MTFVSVLQRYGTPLYRPGTDDPDGGVLLRHQSRLYEEFIRTSPPLSKKA
jgi:hypothetical protein